MTRSSYGQPAFFGGLVMGVLSALPFINLGNACCCLWVLSGGVFAAYLLQQNQAEPLTPGDGALVGLLAGLIGAVIQVVVSTPISLVIGPMERAMAQRVLDMAGNMPTEMRGAFDRLGPGAGMAWMVAGSVIGLMFWLFIGAIFSTLGGLIGVAIFKKTTPPPGSYAGETGPPA